MIKKCITRLFGQRKTASGYDFSALQSVLLKPIGDAIGDAILHISHLSQLKQAFPHLKIGVLVSERNRAIFQFSGIVDALIEDNWRSYLQHRGKWQLYLDFMPTYTSRAIILDNWLKPEIVINFGKAQKKHYNRETVKNADFVTEIPTGTHFKDYLSCSVLAPFLSSPIFYTLPEPQSQKPSYTNEKINILLNPQGSNRQLDPKELLTLLQQINTRYRDKIALFVTNIAGCEQYESLFAESQLNIQFAPKVDLFGYFSLIFNADLVISVDSAAVHIACAYSKPLLAFYANYPSAFERWKPNPKPTIDTLTLVGKPAQSNAQTQDFDMSEAAIWLNKQLAQLIENKEFKDTQ